MRRLATLAVVVVAALVGPTVASGQDYSFGDWARDRGYSPGDAMPTDVDARSFVPAIESLNGIGEFDWTTTPTMALELTGNQITRIESGAFSGLTDLKCLNLNGNTALTELNLAEADFPSLVTFGLDGNVNIASASLKNVVLNQRSLATLLNGGAHTGIGELDGVTEMDLSGIDFVDITDLEPLYLMDDLTDLWLVDTQNVDATQLDVLLDNLETIEGTDTEGILHMTLLDFIDFVVAGDGLLAAWDAEPGHHVEYLLLGGVNHDTEVNGLDVDPFLDVLLASRFDVAADMNGDGVVNGLDVRRFTHTRESQRTTGVSRNSLARCEFLPVDRDLGTAMTPSALGAPDHTRRSGHGWIATGQTIAEKGVRCSDLELADMGIFQRFPTGAIVLSERCGRNSCR